MKFLHYRLTDQLVQPRFSLMLSSPRGVGLAQRRPAHSTIPHRANKIPLPAFHPSPAQTLALEAHALPPSRLLIGVILFAWCFVAPCPARQPASRITKQGEVQTNRLPPSRSLVCFYFVTDGWLCLLMSVPCTVRLTKNELGRLIYF